MKQLDRPGHGETEVRNWVGNGVERLVRRALIGKLDGEPTDEDFDRAYPIFLELYDRHNGEKSRLYAGVREGIDYLKTTGIHLGCVTNKAEQFTVPLLKALGIYDDFEIVISGDTLPKKKPDPLPLLHAAEHFGIQPSEALMLGDSISDVKAARAAGFSIFCMSYGYNHGVDIREAEPDAVLDSMTEISGLLPN
jgi:phosphoglycolate phosphatase